MFKTCVWGDVSHSLLTHLPSLLKHMCDLWLQLVNICWSAQARFYSSITKLFIQETLGTSISEISEAVCCFQVCCRLIQAFLHMCLSLFWPPSTAVVPDIFLKEFPLPPSWTPGSSSVPLPFLSGRTLFGNSPSLASTDVSSSCPCCWRGPISMQLSKVQVPAGDFSSLAALSFSGLALTESTLHNG